MGKPIRDWTQSRHLLLPTPCPFLHYQDDSAEINAFDPRLTVEELSDQVLEVVKYYG